MKKQSKIEKPATWEPEGVFTTKVIVIEAYSSRLDTGVTLVNLPPRPFDKTASRPSGRQICFC